MNKRFLAKQTTVSTLEEKSPFSICILRKEQKAQRFFFISGLPEMSSARVYLYYSNTVRYWTQNGGNF